MAASPDHSWSELLGSYAVKDDMGDDKDLETIPLNTTKLVLSDGSENSLKDPESTPLTHKCVNCNLQVTCPVCNYPPEFSDTTSLMSSSSQDSTCPQSPVSCPGKPPPSELCLSPLQEPLQRGMMMQPAYMTHSSPRYVDASDPDAPPGLSLPTSMSVSVPRSEVRPKQPSETCTESSTQTELELCEMPFPPAPAVPPPPPPPAMRSDSRTSLASTAVVDVCRICHCESEPGAPLISPCVCCGSLKFVHQSCLQQWIKSADTKSCELCRFDFQMTTRIKPFRKWQKLEMTTVERRKIMCSVTFHIIAITCVIWSLYVLIDRTTEEIKEGSLEWPFWTKLIVLAIGFTGGIVFMYVQCKMYVQLCRRWRAYNRVIYIQNCPNLTGQKIPLQAHMLNGNGLPKQPTPPPPH